MNPDPLLAKLQLARAEQDLANVRYANALSAAFPTGTTVTVTHRRGAYHGEVTGVDPRGHRIIVRNFATGKHSAPYPGMSVNGIPAVQIRERPAAGERV